MAKLGLYEKALPAQWQVAEKLAAAGRVGYDYLELSIDETDQKLARLSMPPAALRQAVEQTNVPIGSICLSGHRKYPLGSSDAAVRKRALDISFAAVDLAAALGIGVIQLTGYDVYYEPSTDRTRGYFEENLFRSVQYAAQAGVILAFETMETPFMNTVEKAMRYVTAVRSPYLQVYPDVGNVTNATPDPIGDLRTGAGHIVAVHLKETVPNVFRDMQFGEGRVDFDAAIAELQNNLGVGRFVAEFWYDGKTEPSAYIERAYRFCRSRLDRG